ncbi:hypothetical protein P9112_012154 [Eukaryota sp. TZLM1-RC]
MDTHQHVIIIPPGTSSFPVIETLRSSYQFKIAKRKSILLEDSDAQFVFLSNLTLYEELRSSLTSSPVEVIYVIGDQSLPSFDSSIIVIPQTQIVDILEFVFGKSSQTLLQNTPLESTLDVERRKYLDDILSVLTPALEQLLRVAESRNVIENPSSQFNPIEWLGAYLMRNSSS